MEKELNRIRRWLGQGSINIFGMPFAGKDTQGGELADLLGAELLGGGKILRGSVIPPHVKDIMDAGGLIPTDDYLRIVLPFLSDKLFEGRPLLLSSVGRCHGEEEGVLQATAASGHTLKAVVYLEIPETVAKERHQAAFVADRGERADDAIEVLETRLSEFREKTLPVIDFYRHKDLLIKVDGGSSPVAVTNEIIGQLGRFIETKAPNLRDLQKSSS